MRSIAPLLTFVVTGVISMFLHAFIPWLAFLVAFTVIWDGIAMSKGCTASRKTWIVASGIAAGFLNLALGLFLQFWGVGGITLPVFLVGLAFALIVDTSLQRWDVA
jgi:hypothetical protein